MCRLCWHVIQLFSWSVPLVQTRPLTRCSSRVIDRCRTLGRDPWPRGSAPAMTGDKTLVLWSVWRWSRQVKGRDWTWRYFTPDTDQLMTGGWPAVAQMWIRVRLYLNFIWTSTTCDWQKQVLTIWFPVKHLYDIYAMLDQRRRRWADVV